MTTEVLLSRKKKHRRKTQLKQWDVEELGKLLSYRRLGYEPSVCNSLELAQTPGHSRHSLGQGPGMSKQ